MYQNFVGGMVGKKGAIAFNERNPIKTVKEWPRYSDFQVTTQNQCVNDICGGN